MRTAALLLALFVAVPASAQERPIRIWGPPAMRGLIERWAEAYRRRHPEARFELTLRGSDTAIPGLYGGEADIALMARPNDAVDDAGFSRPLGYPVTRVAIASGSVSAPGKAEAVAVLVDARNPVATLTLAQLARAIDCGGKAPPARRWGDLGAGGAWAARPIRVQAIDLASRTGAFVQHVVTGGGRRMCWDRITEWSDAKRLDGTLEEAADRAGAAARGDPDALVIADAAQARDGLKLVALVAADGAPSLPVAADVVAGRYPLARRAYAYLNRRPGTAADPRAAAFLAWVLSAEGQALLGVPGDFLPLDPATAAASRAVLEARR